MKIVWIALALTLSLVAPAAAKRFAFPQNDPAATVTIPDTWTTRSIEYGFEAHSPDDSVFLSIESASANSMKKMLDANMAWMKGNKISVTGKPTESDINLGGVDAKMQVFPAKDENGETQMMLIMSESNKRLIFITLWASEAEQKANDKDINAIMGSIKAIQ